MEEAVGKIWHRLITRAAGGSHPAAAVSLKQVERTVGVMFRALGGDGGLRVAAATEDTHGARRSWLARIAGSGEKLARARIDDATLRLPPQIDAFPDPALNRELYLWLAALAAAHGELNHIATEAMSDDDTPAAPDAVTRELRRNQHATLHVLARWPGLASRYRRIVAATLAQRPDPNRMPAAEAAREHALRRALEQPGSVLELPTVPDQAPPSQPLLPWLACPQLQAPEPVRSASQGEDTGHAVAPSHPGEEESERRAHKAERVDTPEQKHGLLMFFRAESLLSVAEFIKVNRSEDDDPDPNAAAAAANLDQLSLTCDGERTASKVRFDLDLPSAAEDDVVLGAGIPLPEWDYRKKLLREDHVRLLEMAAAPDDPRAAPAPLPEHLRRTARRLHQQFALLQPGRRWIKGQVDGSELDVDAAVRSTTDRACGQQPSDLLWLTLEKRERDMACLALADLSLSTDTWVSSEARVIDVIRDSLLLFGEALTATGDRFALCGFSSVKRSNVRFHHLKGFDERFDDRVRGRVIGIKPGYYTRLGAAIRHATGLLDTQKVSRRVLLILSDGKPNDLDLYDGRYGIEDTRMAVIEARRRGVVPFCVTIDREGASYLPHLFGPNGFAVIRKPDELPARLPMFYAQLTR
ncbi:VWA domain-containing protein [Azoarcus communis]|uniref:nitric oxide reductase activation protein NorD n=1 Tax=Parazoarcus communis TaxID=41977 RepID=UPI0014596842|nr:VWA domain-containing protein [Parazoarcus communis]NMG50602.1 VWA domain-containing protein [Parazoarcus communis]